MATKSPTITNSQGKTLYLSASGHSYGATPPTTVTNPAPKGGQVLGASTDAPAGSLKDLSVALAQQFPQGDGSLKDLSIGLAKGNKITQEDITRAQGGGPSLSSLTTPVPSLGGSSSPKEETGTRETANQTAVENGYYSRTKKDNTPVVEQPSLEEIQKNLTKQSQKEINSLYQYQADLLAEQQNINQQNERATASVNTLTGLAGSSEANINQQRTTQQGQQANRQIVDAVQTQVQGVLSSIRKDAFEHYKYLKGEARLDAKDALTAKKTREEKALTNVSLLAQSGATIEGYKQTDPEGYKYLAEQVGGEEMMKAMFTLNRPQDTILDKKIEGGKYIISFQNPLDGKIRIETVDLGLPPQYTKTIDAGNRIVAVPDNWDGDPSKLITINKGLTPKQAQGSTSSAGGGNTQYSSDLDAIVGATKAIIPTKFGQQTFDSQMARTRNDGDKINLVASVVLGKADSQTKSDFANQAVGINQIDKAIKLLDQGVQTGVIQNGVQYAYNIFGKDFDPNLAQINQYITSAIQPYRNSVTGAAWGEQEDGEYNQLFGSTKYSPDELKQRLVGVKEILKSKSATALGVYVNPMGYYDNPFASGNLGSEGSDIESQKAELRAQGYSEEQIQQLVNS